MKVKRKVDATLVRYDPEDVRKDTLPNGVRVLSETIPGLQSVAIALWVESGRARIEQARLSPMRRPVQS